MRRFALFFLILFGFCVFLEAQPHPFPLNREHGLYVLGHSPDSTFNFHSGIFPFAENKLDFLNSGLKQYNIETQSAALKMLMNVDPIDYPSRSLSLEFWPIIQAEMMMGKSNDSSDSGHWLGIGAATRLTIGKKFAAGGDYTYSNMAFADYIEAYSEQEGIVPGFGSIDSSSRNNEFYNFYISYDAADFLNLEFGKGKHFIGHGYRSLLLSDNSNSYLYGKIQLDIWKIKYQVLYSAYRDISGVEFDPGKYRSKYSTSNYLSMNFGKHLEAGLFQSVVWQATNGDHNRGFDVNYLNPIVFMRPVEFSVGSPDNVLMGLDLAYRFYKKYKIYTQVVIDEFLLSEIRAGDGWWANKYGFQIGFKTWDLFNVKGLSLQLERNEVRPYTYSHGNVIQNYGHYNAALAHTLGANFEEYISRITYQKKRWLFTAHLLEAFQGLDEVNTNYGGDIYKFNTTRQSGYGNYTGQGLKSHLSYQELKVSYLINPFWNLLIEAGMVNRQRITQDRQSEFGQYFHLGIKTALYNQYKDF